MPLPPTQPMEARPQRVVRMLPNVAENKILSAPITEFLLQELIHWQSELEARQKEGEYYLGWLAWLEPDIPEGKKTRTFTRLLRHEIPALCRLIENQSRQLRDPDLEQLLSIQQAYIQFCELYDEIKLEVLEDKDWGSGLAIY